MKELQIIENMKVHITNECKNIKMQSDEDSLIINRKQEEMRVDYNACTDNVIHELAKLKNDKMLLISEIKTMENKYDEQQNEINRKCQMTEDIEYLTKEIIMLSLLKEGINNSMEKNLAKTLGDVNTRQEGIKDLDDKHRELLDMNEELTLKNSKLSNVNNHLMEDINDSKRRIKEYNDIESKQIRTTIRPFDVMDPLIEVDEEALEDNEDQNEYFDVNGTKFNEILQSFNGNNAFENIHEDIKAIDNMVVTKNALSADINDMKITVNNLKIEKLEIQELIQYEKQNLMVYIIYIY